MSELTRRLEALCAGFPGTPGVCARNLATGEEVAFNDRLRFPTASMIKILILFELVRSCARGEARMDERRTLQDADRTLGSGLLVDFHAGAELTLRDLAVLMMAISDNTATNILIDRLGKDGINQAIREAGMAETELRNKIDFDLLAQSPEALAVTTPRDYVQFFTRLRGGQLLPAEQVEELLSIMRIQKYIEPMRKLLPFSPYAREFGEPCDVWVASKTGGLKGVRCESGLVHTPRAEWTLSVCTRGFDDPAWSGSNIGSQFISDVSKAVYDTWS